MSKQPWLLMLPLVLLLGCQPDTPKKEAAVGADRDAHGCIPSAGYQWCEQQQQCVRPWELAKQDEQLSDEDNFKAQCQPH